MKALVIAFARVTLEALSPIIVSSGGGDDVADAICTRDANGIPMIPGTSIAGVLRHAGGYTAEKENPFGYQLRDKGQRSRVVVHDAYAHDACDRPVDPRPGRAAMDPVLRAMCEGVVRDHVRLGENGTAEHNGKFDERLVPRGARFTFDAYIEGGTLSDLAELLAPLGAPDAALGGRTRRGFGRVEIVRAAGDHLDLRTAEDRTRWGSLQRGDDVALPPLDLSASASLRERGTLRLSPLDYWMFGRGDDFVESLAGGRTRRTQLTPFREDVITWCGPSPSSGAVVARSGEDRDTRRVVIPASGIKGALRHRTLFHARRHAGEWFPGPRPEGRVKSAAERAIDTLFGFELESARRREGRPGVFYLDDLCIAEVRTGRLDHVSLDAFTGAPIDGALFGEEPVFGGAFELPFALDLAALEHPSAGPFGRDLRAGIRALVDALDDLCAGRLAIGGGVGRGHGYMSGVFPTELRERLLAAAREAPDAI